MKRLIFTWPFVLIGKRLSVSFSCVSSNRREPTRLNDSHRPHNAPLWCRWFVVFVQWDRPLHRNNRQYYYHFCPLPAPASTLASNRPVWVVTVCPAIRVQHLSHTWCPTFRETRESQRQHHINTTMVESPKCLAIERVALGYTKNRNKRQKEMNQ